MTKISPRKIFDILPPEKYEEKPAEKKEVGERKIRFFLLTPFKRKILIIFSILLIVVALSFYFVFQKTIISIWPETQKPSFKEQIVVDKNFKEYDFLAKIIPGEFFEEEKIISEEFSSTGKISKETKAEGIIRVYNAYSTTSQTLVKNTRFVSADGKLFRSLEQVTIPGGTYEGRTLQPGFLDIKVQAAEVGPEYNIGPSTLSIPGLAGTPKYAAFYGKSFQSMSGGFKGEGFQITQKDLENGEKILKENLTEVLKFSPKNKFSEEYILLERASKIETFAPIFSGKAGDEGEKFTGQIKGIFKALLFKKADLEKIVKDFVLAKIAQDQNFKEGSLNINYLPETIDLEGGKIILNLDFSATIYAKFDTEGLKRELAGKSRSEALLILEENSKITKFELNTSSFWLKKVPANPDKIKIELIVD